MILVILDQGDTGAQAYKVYKVYRIQGIQGIAGINGLHANSFRWTMKNNTSPGESYFSEGGMTSSSTSGQLIKYGTEGIFNFNQSTYDEQ